MNCLIVLGIFFGILFLAMFITKRRLGVPGLALAAGSLLSNLWVGELTPLVAQAGVEIVRPPLSSIVAILLTLFPPLLVFFSGKSVQGLVWRVVSSAAFGLLAVALLLGPLSNALVIDATAKPVYDMLVKNQALIVTATLGMAVLDLLFANAPRREKHGKH